MFDLSHKTALVTGAGKGGGLGFTRHIAIENARHGITTNTLSLGLMGNLYLVNAKDSKPFALAGLRVRLQPRVTNIRKSYYTYINDISHA